MSAPALSPAALSPAALAGRVLLPFALGYLLSFLFRSINAVTAPHFAAELGLAPGVVGLLTSAYLLAFALAQLPMGILLDRVGPRRCAAALLLVAAAGAVVFAAAQSLAALAAGRALIGLGVSVALMAAFKANVQFWPARLLPTANAVTMAFGGLGAAAATLPAQWALEAAGWRALFAALAALSVAVAAWQFFAVPDRAAPHGARRLGELEALRAIGGSRLFWAASTAPAVSLGLWIAYNSFWAAPWLREVAGLGERGVGQAMFALSLAIVPGYLFSGVLVDALGRRGVPGRTVLLGYGAAFLAVQLPVAAGMVAAPAALWFGFVMLGGAPVVIYALLTKAFPAELAGRLNTAVNLICLGSAFVMQAAIGPLLDAAQRAAGLDRAAAHGAVLGGLIALQAALWLWFALDRATRRLG